MTPVIRHKKDLSSLINQYQQHTSSHLFKWSSQSLKYDKKKTATTTNTECNPFTKWHQDRISRTNSQDTKQSLLVVAEGNQFGPVNRLLLIIINDDVNNSNNEIKNKLAIATGFFNVKGNSNGEGDKENNIRFIIWFLL